MLLPKSNVILFSGKLTFSMSKQ